MRERRAGKRILKKTGFIRIEMKENKNWYGRKQGQG